MSPQLSSKNVLVSVKSETSYHSPPSSSDASQHENEAARGRRQDRSATAKAEDDSGEEKEDGIDTAGGKHRKRKRSRKGLEKNFPCPHQGCGKSYSRAEHLYRHQLNREFFIHVADWFLCLTKAQTHRRKFIPVIFLDASVDLYGKTYVLGTAKGTQLVARICNGKSTILMSLTTEVRKRQRWMELETRNTGHLLVPMHQLRTLLQRLHLSSKRMRSTPCLPNPLYQGEWLNLIKQPQAAPAHLEAI